MGSKRSGKRKRAKKDPSSDVSESPLHPETLKSVWAVVLAGLALLFGLAGAGYAGPFGNSVADVLRAFLGVGYVLLPLTLIFSSGVLVVSSERNRIAIMTGLGAALMLLSALGMIHVFSPGRGGWLGYALGWLKRPLGSVGAGVVQVALFVIGVLVAANVPIRVSLPERKEKEEPEEILPVITGGEESTPEEASEKKKRGKEEKGGEEEEETFVISTQSATPNTLKKKAVKNGDASYVSPPLELLESASEHPTTGDLRGNANIIKRTLESFGIPVEMGEINIGPKVTRYTLKPAEGAKLSKIEALHKDLALALAAHPIRIEAPIPGKSLVGIEVPNKAAALVRLGSLMKYKEFESSGPLGFALGRDVSGEPVFADIARMPHLLVAGATGSGKSVTIHSIILSLLYKNSPSSLRLLFIDPKRVELPIYAGIPHLLSPVITDNKKAVGVFKWTIGEMERRYDLLSESGSRDLKSYNTKNSKTPLPYILVVVDELADLMTSYGRDVEGSIVRLAQMARATGIHLILATQRPSVEIITGLIKANITARIALQVASQIDSRTILDTSGAEKLLGGGDLLFTTSDLSKPKRVQGSYVTEEEIRKVADFIREKNALWSEPEGMVELRADPQQESGISFDEYVASEDDDELLLDAIGLVREAGKASASLLQRRLKVGYARAARLLDLMEDRGIVGPGDGAKPREVYEE